MVSTIAEWRVIHRVTFPTDRDPTTLPLYIDERVALTNTDVAHRSARDIRDDIEVSADPSGKASATSMSTSKSISRIESHSAQFSRRSTVSFATYFNAFPAAYWRQWTNVKVVRLTVELRGRATINVYRSTSRGTLNRIDGAVDASGTSTFDVSLENFGDGGWLWFDLQVGDESVALLDAHWSAPAVDATRTGTATISITTFNRPDDCVAQMKRLAAAPQVLERIDEVLFVDQGNKQIVDAADYAESSAALGDKLRIEVQANLGGSGGFARGMYETAKSRTSDYVLLLDDDILIEPESILRTIDFADFAMQPTIVGGHMLNLFERSVLHSYGEAVNLYRTMWYAVDPSLESFNFATRSLRSVASIHKRVDVDFNGWWMCLIPRTVVDEIGLSLPVFIKWDDAEYGLRARAHGIPTVSLPGAAVWHMPWTEKDDRLDWQAYFHQRNRWLVAMLYSDYRRGGTLLRDSIAADIKHLLTLQYSPVAMRIQALEDLLSGPDHLHATLESRAAEMRQLNSSFSDGAVIREVSSYPQIERRRLPKRGVDEAAPHGRLRWIARAALSFVRQTTSPSQEGVAPEKRLAASDVRWWRLSGVDAALVSTADGRGVTVYRRDRHTFRSLLRQSIVLHLRLRRDWNKLSKQYRSALPTLTSPEVWERTFGVDDDTAHR